MADIDSNMVKFNRTHLEFIRRIAEIFPNDVRSQRIKYIADLMSFFPKKEQVENFPKDLSLSLESIRIYAEQHPQFLANFDDSLWPKESSSFLRDILMTNRRANILFGYERVGTEKYYWECDDGFKKIVSALENQRIAVANIDLVQWDVINDFVAKTQLHWGILDSSNSSLYKNQKTENDTWFLNIQHSRRGPKNYLYTGPNHNTKKGFAYYSTDKLGFLQYLGSLLGPAYFIYSIDDVDNELMDLLDEAAAQ